MVCRLDLTYFPNASAIAITLGVYPKPKFKIKSGTRASVGVVTNSKI